MSAAGLTADFLRAAGGGLLVGILVFLVVAWVRQHIDDPLLDTGMSLVIPFAAYLLAEAEPIHGSGVIAVVVAGLLLGHKAPIIQTAQSRIAERMNWRTIAYVLENAVFLLIGLQADWIVADVSESDLSSGRIALVCAATLVAVVVLRLVWVFPARYLLVRPGPAGRRAHGPPWTYTFILGWAGMRGVVTLAAAFVIPERTPEPRDPAADRVHRRGRHAVHPGAVAAVVRAPAQGPAPGPGGRRAGPRDHPPAGLEGGLQAARRRWSTTTRTASWSRSGSGSTSATTRPGSG